MRRTFVSNQVRKDLSFPDTAIDSASAEPDAFAALVETPTDNVVPQTASSGRDLPVAPATQDVLAARMTSATVASVSSPRLRIFDVIPTSDSAETGQNSEPSLAVNPLNAAQMIVGAFSGTGMPYFISLNGGATWADYGSLSGYDKTLAWKQDGSAALTSTLYASGSSYGIRTYSGITTASSFGSPINSYNPKHDLDQPWMRTGPSNHVYVGYNDLSAASGKTASVLVSTNGGSTYTPVTLDRVGGGVGQDGAPIRLAVNGNTAYAVFTRWNSLLDTDSFGEERFTSQVMIVRSDNGGADGFTALGANGNGVPIATPTSWYANTENAPLTLGQERTVGELAIAVDPDNASHVVVAYGDAPGPTGSGQMQLTVAESTDDGAHWQTKFTTSSSTRSALPALAITQNGTIGLLYDNYDPVTNRMSQHLLTTSDDFVTTTDTTLASETNATPVARFDPYVGDFYDMTSIGNTFYGVFSASNADNGSDAQFTNVMFQRDFIGTPGTASFQMTDGSGHTVAPSIDPFFFTYQAVPTAPAPSDFNGDGTSDVLWRNDSGDINTWLLNNGQVAGGTAPGVVSGAWQFAGAGDLDGNGTSDVVWQNTTTGEVDSWLITNGQLTGGAAIGIASNAWTPLGTGNFNNDSVSDLLWRNANGEVDTWLMNNGHQSGGTALGFVSSDWQFSGIGDFNGDGTSDAVWHNATTGEVDIWLITNDHLTDDTAIGFASSAWQSLGAGDFNADGVSDILWRNTNTGEVDTWLMNNGHLVGGAALGSVSSAWQFAGIGDYSGNGTSDILWRNNNSGEVDTWLITNDHLTGGTAIGTASTAWQPQVIHTS